MGGFFFPACVFSRIRSLSLTGCLNCFTTLWFSLSISWPDRPDDQFQRWDHLLQEDLWGEAPVLQHWVCKAPGIWKTNAAKDKLSRCLQTTRGDKLLVLDSDPQSSGAGCWPSCGRRSGSVRGYWSRQVWALWRDSPRWTRRGPRAFWPSPKTASRWTGEHAPANSLSDWVGRGKAKVNVHNTYNKNNITLTFLVIVTLIARIALLIAEMGKKRGVTTIIKANK